MNVYTRMLGEVERKRKSWLAQETITVGDLYRLFPQTNTRIVKFEDLCVTNKTAIVLLGPSVYGKTTFAKEFLKMNKTVLICSMDECSRRAYRLGFMDDESNDRVSLKYFGERLEMLAKKNMPVIIDGLWINIYTRAALFNTLRKIGFSEICVIDFITKYDPQIHDDNIMWRAVDLIAWKTLIEIRDVKSVREADVIYEDTRRLLSEHYGISEEELAVMIASKQEFKDEVKRIRGEVIGEIKDNHVAMQKQYGLFRAGADIYTSI